MKFVSLRIVKFWFFRDVSVLMDTYKYF